jgi:quercetin dioxygenase-like cupin family protein
MLPFHKGMLFYRIVKVIACSTLLKIAWPAARWLKKFGSKPMEIKRSGSQPSAKGPEAYFTGAVRVDPLFDPPAPARILGASVTFEPGARTAWHTHPLGQTLIVTAGVGWTQCVGEPRQEIRQGDVIWCPPGKKHWHGATPTTAMTHIAIVEKLDGKGVDWMEKVTDEQYLKGDAS